MDFGKTYLWDCAGKRGALHVRPRSAIADPLALLQQRYIPDDELTLEQYMGRRPLDIVGTTHAVLFLVSDRVAKILTENKVSGWGQYRVRIVGKDSAEISGYSGLSVLGRCGPIDNSKSQVVMKEPPTPEGRAYRAWRGLYFDPESWDGSEIFCPDGSGHVFVTNRVQELLGGATNARFRALSEVERASL